MKKTRKWAFIGQEAQRLAGLGMTPAEIARQIGVHRSTVLGWVKTGKITRSLVRRKVGGGTVPKAPGEWAASVRQDYALDATDEQLVTTGQQALELAYNMAETPTTRLTAMGRFQSIVKQLSLGLSDRRAEAPDVPAVVPRQVHVRAVGGVDPRNILQAVR